MQFKYLSQLLEQFLFATAIILLCADHLTAAAQLKPAWQQEWEKTLEAAKKEGQVTVYISGYEAVLPHFEKEFPEIKVVAVTGRGNQLGQRLLTERRADRHLADVVSSGANPNYQQFYSAKALDPIKPALMLPEVVDQTKWYLKKHQYSDPEGQYVFNYVGSATYGAVNYNGTLVDSKDFKSYWDLLNPKWKGKIEVRDIREAGPGAGNTRFFYYHADLGPAFIRKLFGEMDATLFRDFRQGPDWLATGKYAICFFCDVDVLNARACRWTRLARGCSRKAAVWFSNSARWRWSIARPIPTRRRCSSIGYYRAAAKSPCSRPKSTPRVPRTRCASIFPKTTFRWSIGAWKALNIWIPADRNGSR